MPRALITAARVIMKTKALRLSSIVSPDVTSPYAENRPAGRTRNVPEGRNTSSATSAGSSVSASGR
jgi:hypothetical protein